MSGTTAVALAAVIVSGVVGVATLAFNFWNAQRERDHQTNMAKLDQEEKYRIGLYAKRLEIHQQAYKWLMDLIFPLRNVIEAKEGDLSLSDKKSTLRRLANQARSWWDGNCLYLDDKSRSLVVNFVEECLARANDEFVPELEEELHTYLEGLRAIQEGIGTKYLGVSEPRA